MKLKKYILCILVFVLFINITFLVTKKTFSSKPDNKEISGSYEFNDKSKEENTIENDNTNNEESNSNSDINSNSNSNSNTNTNTNTNSSTNTSNKNSNNNNTNTTTAYVVKNTFSKVSGNELFYEYYSKAESIVKKMTLQERVGQMFLVRYSSKASKEIKNYFPGGYILFAKDFQNETKASILKKINNHQKNSKIKMLFAVDEEGGTVVRVSLYKNFRSSKFLSPQQLYKKGGLDLIISDTIEKDNLLHSIGINMNLAPVADVSISSNDFIYKRSLGLDSSYVSSFVEAVVKQMNSDNMISALKHFPGYGNNKDTHTGIAIDKRDYSVFTSSDFLPFISGIKENAPCIMVSHNVVTSMDSSYPASISKKVHNILRNELDFSGIIITDDLAMSAMKKYTANNSAAILAVSSGNDLIITSSFANDRKQVINAVKNNKINEKIINDAVRRIIAFKLAYNII